MPTSKDDKFRPQMITYVRYRQLGEPLRLRTYPLSWGICGLMVALALLFAATIHPGDLQNDFGHVKPGQHLPKHKQL